MRTGLTLGKFAPLHRGHQYLIERALEQCDHLIVLIYAAEEVTAVPLPVRAGWIRELYPQVEVIEAWDGPTEVGESPEITQRHDAYILEKMAGRCISVFFSSEFYGGHVSRALGAVDCRVDQGWENVAISATLIRSDPFAHREFLESCVYRDLLTWVVFLGAPSTGKTTLCQALAERLETAWVPEFGRTYWEAHQVERRLTPGQLLEIATGHRLLEEQSVMHARSALLIDTNATTTRLFCQDYHGTTTPELDALAAATCERYDVVFLCDDDIPYDNTSDRSGEMKRGEFQSRIREDLVARKIPFTTLSGDLEQRIATAIRILAE